MTRPDAFPSSSAAMSQLLMCTVRKPGCFVLASLVAAAAPAFSADPPAGVVTTLQGQATVARAADVQPLGFRDPVFLKDRIDTAERSVVRVLLGGKALVTVRELSSLTITETPGRAVVDLGEGTVGLEVARKLLAPGESVQIRTPNAIAAVRGSFIVVEVTLPDGAPRSRVVAREISLPVSVSWSGGEATLASNHTLSVRGSGASVAVTRPRPITARELAQADQTRSGGREPKHDDELAQGLKSDLEEETQEAEKELEELAALENEEGSDGTSTSELGVNELAATRAGGVGGSSSGLTPDSPGVIGVVGLIGTGGPGGGPGGGVPPPPVLPPPVPSASGPGFSEFSGARAGNANPSATGISPPSNGLGGNGPRGLTR